MCNLLARFHPWSSLLKAMVQSNSNTRTAEDYLQTDKVVGHQTAASHVRIYGKDSIGEHIVIVPSLGRGVEDYTEVYSSTLTTRFADAGYRVILIQPRGIGKSTGDLTPEIASMSLFSNDIKCVLDALGIGRAHLIGHAFGNRLARTYATLYPDSVDRLVLMAAGGNFRMNEGQLDCVSNALNLSLPDEERLKYLQRAFFARANDASVWLQGWYANLARAQIMAAKMINGEFFKRAGGKPFLLIQAAEDFVAPPDMAGRALMAELGDQVSYVEIPETGHALSSERPDVIAKHIINYFSE